MLYDTNFDIVRINDHFLHLPWSSRFIQEFWSEGFIEVGLITEQHIKQTLQYRVLKLSSVENKNLRGKILFFSFEKQQGKLK